ncbi:MAG TPA: bifunctional cytidylyltransferase/SDR family oxidoreductase [Sphingomicrobium sp.]|nr:bifunctional cytidylyltransferase/SDR family oxidoreductase [Sphingomicrobium sp.]
MRFNGRSGAIEVTSRTIAVILAGGIGERGAFSRPKQLVKLAGRPVIAHALERFQTHDGIDEICIVTNDLCRSDIEELVSREQLTKVKRVLLGGSERYESSLAAIRAYEADAREAELLLLFHDAVRPLVSHGVISDVITALEHYDAVDVAIGVADTVIQASPRTNTIEAIPDRRLLRLGQTPQGFAYGTIRQAYERALKDPQFTTTDDCGVVVKYMPETKVFVVEGDASNLKLTFQTDLMIIDKFMQSNAGRRVNANAETLLLSGLQGRHLAIVGATSGIGQAMAELAGAYGASVSAAGRSTGLDIGDGEKVQRWLEEARDERGPIDAVVNAAAVLDRQPLMSMTLEQIRASIETNFLGAANVAWAAHPHLVETKGHLMFFASSSYTYGRALYSTYSASKAAVVNLTQALADEWSEIGIRVNCINPERARTPMRVRAFGNEPAETLLDAEDVARRALSVLIGNTSGIIYDIVKV